MARNNYTPPTLTGYNANPPSDDGAQTENNRVRWALTVIAKVGDPLRTFAEAISSAITSALNSLPLNSVTNQATSFTVTTDDDGKLFSVTGNSTVTLPEAATAGAGFQVTIKKAEAANTVTVQRSQDVGNTDTIDGQENVTLTEPFSALTIVSDGSTSWELASDAARDRRLPPNFLDGMAVSNNGTDSANDIDVAAGFARDADDNGDIIITSTMVKQIDAVFAEGTGAGGLDTGTVAADTIYFIWAIAKAADGVADVLLSTSSTAPTMPSGFDLKVLIDRIKTNSSSQIINNAFYPSLRSKEGPDWTTINLAASFPSAISDEKEVPFFEQWDEVVMFFRQLSPDANNRIDFQIGDGTDYTTGMTYDGSTSDESGVNVNNWSGATAISLGQIQGGTLMSGRVIFRRVPDADAVTIFGANNIAWQVDVLAQPSSGSSDRIHGSGWVATTKTAIDLMRVILPSGLFDDGEWGVMAR